MRPAPLRPLAGALAAGLAVGLAVAALPARASAQAAPTLPASSHPAPAADWRDPEPDPVVPVYQRMLDALVRRDTAALRRVLAPGYLFTRGTTGEVSGAAERIHALATSASSTSVLRVEGCRTRLHGDAAVAACRVTERGTSAAGAPFHGIVLSTVVLVRDTATRDWRIAATHTAPTPSYSMPK